MDYALTKALNYNMDGIKRAIVFYDINCSFMKHLRSRIDRNKSLSIPANLQLIPGIGIWHVHGHQPSCFARYAPLFIDGVGWLDGEIIETLWSILNVVSPSTRTMTTPHRQEMLDFQMNDSNFQKMIRMSNLLRRSVDLC
jgi:Kyakuja-Dileera-Zisupton transposase